MSETTNNEKKEVTMTQAEMEQARKNMVKYYTDQMPLIKAQLAYETAIADIEEARARAMTMVIRQVQMKSGPLTSKEPVEESEPSPEEIKAYEEMMEAKAKSEKSSRKLKTED
jgi:hypothetical protein